MNPVIFFTEVVYPEVTLGQRIDDAATVDSEFSRTPTGTVTFRAYGPDDEDCSGEPAFTYEATLPEGIGGVSTLQSPEPFVPQAVGTYRWTAEYSGDDFYRAATSECNAENGQTLVVEQSATSVTEHGTLP